MFGFVFVHLYLFFVLYVNVQMSPFKSSAVKGGNSKGKELVIDVDDPSPRSKRTRFSTEVYDLELFRSYVTFQTYMNYFRDAPLLVERVVDQSSLFSGLLNAWRATERFYVEGFKFLFDNTSLCCPHVCISLPLIFAI